MNADFFLFFSARKMRHNEPRAAESGGGGGGRRRARIEAGLMGWGGSGRRYLKAAPGRCPARVRPEVGSFFLIIPLGRKVKRNTKRTPKIPK